MAAKPTLIAIVGPTASGKTGLAVEMAERWNGEIICADSRTIYKGMDIGTAKPTKEEQARVPHWGLDLVEPNEKFSVADFKQYADEKIADIRRRGKLPLLVGGTGLYVDAVLYRYAFGEEANPSVRQALEAVTIDELRIHCVKHNIKLPENSKNKRYVIRAIERKSVSGISRQPLQRTDYIVGIATDNTMLRTRIVNRTEQLFQNNVAEEATMLGKKYGWNHEAMTGNIYQVLKPYLEGAISLDETMEQFTTLDWRLAKRQMTWLRRNPDILWCTLTEAKTYINSLLATE
jgi:tRNA dimethylallyltransferase